MTEGYVTTTTQLKAGGLASLPTPPTGWPIGSYATYAEAQRAVDYLADAEFPVQDVTIVGVEPMVVERVTARLTWGRVLAGGQCPVRGSVCWSACCSVCLVPVHGGQLYSWRCSSVSRSE